MSEAAKRFRRTVAALRWAQAMNGWRENLARALLVHAREQAGELIAAGLE